MAINIGSRVGHPDHGIGGPSGISGHSAGSGMESAFGGNRIGPDAFGGMGITPRGGYTGLAANAMNIRGRQEMAGFLHNMSKKYGFDSVRNFITGYMGMVETPVNPNLDVSQQQNEMISNAVRNYRNPPMGNVGMFSVPAEEEDFGIPAYEYNQGIFGPSQAELNAINQNQPSYAEQAQNMNFAPPGFGPSQGLGLGSSQLGLGNFGDQ